MKTYESNTPRTAIAFVAAAMTALTLSLSVIAPAIMESGSSSADTVIASRGPAQPGVRHAIPTRAEI